MSNSALIVPKNKNVGIYLHWNGGPVSVGCFLEYCEMKRLPTFGGRNHSPASITAMCQVINNFFGGSTFTEIIDSVYLSSIDINDYDNGVYVVDTWKIVNKLGSSVRENYNIRDFLETIDSKQPTHLQLGHSFIYADIVNASDLKIGDKVCLYNRGNNYSIHTVVGIASSEKKIVNGTNVCSLPYVDLYDNDGYGNNINNYIREEKVRRLNINV